MYAKNDSCVTRFERRRERKKKGRCRRRSDALDCMKLGEMHAYLETDEGVVESSHVFCIDINAELRRTLLGFRWAYSLSTGSMICDGCAGSWYNV